jgi:hypothetical protein
MGAGDAGADVDPPPLPTTAPAGASRLLAGQRARQQCRRQPTHRVAAAAVAPGGAGGTPAAACQVMPWVQRPLTSCCCIVSSLAGSRLPTGLAVTRQAALHAAPSAARKAAAFCWPECQREARGGSEAACRCLAGGGLRLVCRLPGCSDRDGLWLVCRLLSRLDVGVVSFAGTAASCHVLSQRTASPLRRTTRMRCPLRAPRAAPWSRRWDVPWCLMSRASCARAACRVAPLTSWASSGGHSRGRRRSDGKQWQQLRQQQQQQQQQQRSNCHCGCALLHCRAAGSAPHPRGGERV